MKYYIIEPNEIYEYPPQIEEWRDATGFTDLTKAEYHNIPNRSTAVVKSSIYTEFLDVVFLPFFAISQNFQNILYSFSDTIEYRELVLIDEENEKEALYLVPKLEQIHEDSYSENLSENIKSIAINKSADALYLFQIKLNGKFFTVARLDVLESFYKHGLRGILPREINIIPTKPTQRNSEHLEHKERRMSWDERKAVMKEFSKWLLPFSKDVTRSVLRRFLFAVIYIAFLLLMIVVINLVRR